MREVEVQMYAGATWVQMDVDLIALNPSYVDLIDLKPSCPSTHLLMDSFSGPISHGVEIACIGTPAKWKHPVARGCG